MKNSTILGITVLLIIVVGGFVFINGKSPTGNVIAENSQVVSTEVQQVVLSMEDLNYNPQEIRVKAGMPVQVSLDSSVKGCLRSVVFDTGEGKFSKFLATPEDTLTFTPTKKGVFTFACSMNMAGGKFIVE